MKIKRTLITVGVVAAALLVLIIGVCLFASPFVSVPAGHTGIVVTFGKVADYTLDPGLHFKNPISKVVLMDNRTQRASSDMQAFSSDIQQMDLSCTINYTVDSSTAQELYKSVGENYYSTVMAPRIQECTKAVFALYSAETLMGVRSSLSTQILDLLAPEMKAYGITVSSVSIEDVDFSDAFTDAVEAKQVAEQNKLRTETEQATQVSVANAEAERRIIAANAEAEERAILAQADAEVAKIQADAAKYAGQKEAEMNEKIASSLTEDLLTYFKYERWDGKLPVFMGGSGESMLIDIQDFLDGGIAPESADAE
jgi:regulator of protease activity HflC (stomatin/prohibitin superfamily)